MTTIEDQHDYVQDFARRLMHHGWTAKDAAHHTASIPLRAYFDRGIDAEDAADEEAALVALESFTYWGKACNT